MPRGVVALLDVLGFSSLVSSDSDGEHLQRYLKCLQEALDDKSVGPTVDYVVFSDSIVLTTEDDSEPGFQAMLLRCSRALGLMLQNDIALRGAIACGSFFRSASPGGVFVAGQAILDAYHFETEQDWVGIMLAPSTIRRIPDLAQRCALPTDNLGLNEETHRAMRERIPWAAFVQPCYRIPFHAGNPFESNNFSGFAIVPTDGVANSVALRDSVKRSLQALERLQSLAPSPSAQAKYSRSQEWLNEIQRKWRDVAYWQERLRNEKTGA